MSRLSLSILVAIFSFAVTQAQEYSFGIKGGVNHSMGGELTGLSSGGIYNDDTFHPESNLGYHGGVFFQLNFGKFFIRPEALYISMETEFDFPQRPGLYEVQKLSVPVLVGYNIFGPIDVYAGPAYQDVLSSNLEGTEDPIVVQNTPLSVHAGIKAGVGRFELDLRYDHTLASREPQGVDIDNSRYGVNRATFNDARLNQVLLSLSFKIGDSEANPRRRSGRGCYF